jgi:hypothetical protein
MIEAQWSEVTPSDRLRETTRRVVRVHDLRDGASSSQPRSQHPPPATHRSPSSPSTTASRPQPVANAGLKQTL